MFSPWWRYQVMLKFHVEHPGGRLTFQPFLSREPKGFERRMHIHKLTGLHRDDVAKKAVPVSQTKACQKGFPCRSTRHPPVSVILFRG